MNPTQNEIGATWLRAYANDQILDTSHWTEATWETLIAWAQGNDLMPLLAYQMRTVADVPSAIRSQFEKTYWTLAARNTVLLHHCGEIIRGLAKVGIPVIVLKGAALAETIYPKIACRPMTDLDLLIEPTDLAVALQTLRDLGYAPSTRDGWGHSTDYLIRFGGELTLLHPALHHPAVDLHWRLFNPEWLVRVIHIPTVELWTRAQSVHIAGTPALQLGQDALWYLCLHLGLHHFGRHPRMLFDIDRVVRVSDSLDWEEFTRQCRAYHIEGFVHLALFAARRWLGTPVPDRTLQELQPSGWRWGIIRALTRIESEFDARLNLIAGADRLLQLVLMPRWQDCRIMIQYALFPSAEWIAARYGVRGRGILLRWRIQHLARILFSPLRVAQRNKRARPATDSTD